jgi:hypothetical protein
LAALPTGRQSNCAIMAVNLQRSPTTWASPEVWASTSLSCSLSPAPPASHPTKLLFLLLVKQVDYCPSQIPERSICSAQVTLGQECGNPLRGVCVAHFQLWGAHVACYRL